MDLPPDSQKNSQNCFTRFLQFFDYFGVNYTFKIKDNSTFQSSFGGVMFFMYLVFAILYIVISFRNFLKREIYTINNSYSVLKPAPEINFRNTRFSLAFSLQYNNDTIPDSSLLNYFNQTIIMTKILNASINSKT